MADIELNIGSGEPCPTSEGTYQARLYIMRSYRPELMHVGLGRDNPVRESGFGIVGTVKHWAEERTGWHISIDRIIGFSVIQLCNRKRHEDGVHNPEVANRAERLGSWVITRNIPIPEEVSSRRPIIFDKRGFGTVNRDPGLVPMNLIELPVTAEERKQYPIQAAIRPYAGTPSMSGPYVALHGDPTDKTIETMVPRDAL